MARTDLGFEDSGCCLMVVVKLPYLVPLALVRAGRRRLMGGR